ncbi:MAG: LuxR C-terminal-related transcriptional regulator [Acidobacteriota bacterium]
MQKGLSKGIGASNLTERENQVLKLLADGYNNEEIGNTLEISRRTVEAYRARIMMKLQISDLPGLVKYAIRSGLTSVQLHRTYQIKRTVAEETLEQQSSL